MTEKKIEFVGFGLSEAVPPTAKAAWGARMIFPDDLLHDRMGHFNIYREETPEMTDEGAKLIKWLEGGALKKACEQARKLTQRYHLTQQDSKQVTLYEDEQGIFVGNPKRSYGYLYVAAWLKPCKHDRLDEDGICRACGGDCRRGSL